MKVEQDALNLPPEQGAFLADRLLSSLSGEVLSDVDAAWVAEAERRYQEYIVVAEPVSIRTLERQTSLPLLDSLTLSAKANP